MGADIATITGLAPAAPVIRVLSRFDRAQIETFAEIAIALLDLQDGDPDLEPEEDMGAEDVGEHRTWTNQVDQRRLSEGCYTFADHHDDAECDDEPEEDDPAGVCDEDGINTAAPCVTSWSGPGCPISDPAEGREDLRP